MRTFFLPLLCVLFLSISFTGLSQVNTQWLPEGTTWHYNTAVFDGPKGINKYQIIGKTTIQDKECSILHKSIEEDICLGRPQMDYIYKENDRLYYYDFEKEAFQLLYDFSVGVRAVYKVPLWKNLNSGFDTLYIRVDSISTFQLDTLSLKQFFVSNGFLFEEKIDYHSDPFPIIEDIGNLRNFFHLVENGFCDYGHTRPLRCFSHPNYNTVSFIEEDCESLILPIKEIFAAKARIFPNPVEHQLSIELPYQGAISWKIFNMEGRVMSEGGREIQKNSPISFSIASLPSSLYYIAVINDQQQLLKKQKFIKL